jgi:hypothetical protein
MKFHKLPVTVLSVAIASALAVRAAAQPPQQQPLAPPPEAGAEDGGGVAPGDFTPEQTLQPPTPQDDGSDGLTTFRGQLSGYDAKWVDTKDKGEVWVPTVPANWRPYTYGQWANTDQGWAWIDEQPWGWATSHYGRWAYDQDLGWAWVPGTVWAPAWVAWREGGGYVGWAPLPPTVGFTAGVGLDFGEVTISSGFFTFVGERDFLAPRLEAVIVPSSRNAAIVPGAAFFSNYALVNNRIVNRGVSVQRIAQATGRAVPQVRVASLAGVGAGGRAGAFYQPPALARAASRSVHSEFGRALPKQLAVQQRNIAIAKARPPAGPQRARGGAGTASGGGSPAAGLQRTRAGAGNSPAGGSGPVRPGQPPGVRPAGTPQQPPAAATQQARAAQAARSQKQATSQRRPPG